MPYITTDSNCKYYMILYFVWTYVNKSYASLLVINY